MRVWSVPLPKPSPIPSALSHRLLRHILSSFSHEIAQALARAPGPMLKQVGDWDGALWTEGSALICPEHPFIPSSHASHTVSALSRAASIRIGFASRGVASERNAGGRVMQKSSPPRERESLQACGF